MSTQEIGLKIKRKNIKEGVKEEHKEHKDIDTKISLLMRSLTEFYENLVYINELKLIVDQNSVISLRILDWFITNYSKKNKVMIPVNGRFIDVYQDYKLQLKSYGKSVFDPFNRKNKLVFYYTDEDFIETSCGQLCFFRWCIQTNILSYVKDNFVTIEQDMKTSLKDKKNSIKKDEANKRKPLSISAARSISKHDYTVKVTFD
jgi:hypothetical protein